MATYLGMNFSFSQTRAFKCSPLGAKENLRFEIKTGGL